MWFDLIDLDEWDIPWSKSLDCGRFTCEILEHNDYSLHIVSNFFHVLLLHDASLELGLVFFEIAFSNCMC